MKTRPARLNRLTGVCLFACAANLLLFGVKLYIGLRANSISVYSDAVNNLFDSLSAGLTFAGLYALAGVRDPSAAHTLQRGEQLFTLLTAAAVCCAGFYFAYCSLERFMYPAPVWYTPLYLGVLLATAAAKFGMYALYRAVGKKEPSPVLRVMRMDCILDFFITAAAALTLALSGRSGFSFDALAGLLISAAIAIPAIRSVVSASAQLLDRAPAETRRAVNEALETPIAQGAVREIFYSVSAEETVCTVLLAAPADFEGPARALERQGIRLRAVFEPYGRDETEQTKP